ncbi:hypothetical protein DL95DRAFT_402216 [Leptodontidium sp. 2 PMI_412]|nr:hypothetical protein DL95DRAFT_402216 [Leptodontidium sp. 2 PMI_412]
MSYSEWGRSYAGRSECDCRLCRDSPVRARKDTPPLEEDRYFKRPKVSFSKPSQEMVTFITGPDDNKQTFSVHKSLACAASPFFKAAFESNMLEGTTQTMRLDDVEAEVFRVLVHYLYFRELDDSSFIILEDATGEACDFDFLLLAKLWKLGERFLMPALQNEVVIELLEGRDSVSDERLKKFAVYVCSTEGDPKEDGPQGKLKRVLLDIVAFTEYRSLFTEIMLSLSIDMVIEVAHVLKGHVPAHHLGRRRANIQQDFFVEIQDEELRLEY